MGKNNIQIHIALAWITTKLKQYKSLNDNQA